MMKSSTIALILAAVSGIAALGASKYRIKFKPRAFTATSLILGLVLASAGPAHGHTPDGSWTCKNGDPGQSNGNCYVHQMNGIAYWYFSNAFPPNAYDAVRVASYSWHWDPVHAEENIYGSNSAEVDWVDGTICGTPAAIACVDGAIEWTYQHIIWPYMQFKYRNSNGTWVPWGVDAFYFPNPWEFDLRSVAAHEFGHLIGIGHSNVQAAVMRSGHDPGEVRRDLSWSGDQYAQCQIYYHSHGIYWDC
jgi:hypothetical protein